MHLKSLKIYCDVIDQQSFSRAAAANDMSQSAISQVVHQIEERLGVKLIDRSRRPFVTTAEGKRYYEGCCQIVRQYDDLEQHILHLHDKIAGRFTVAAIYSVGLAHISNYVREFSAQYPNANVRLEYLHPHRVYEVVTNGSADLGLVSYPQASRRLATIPWRSESILLVCSPNHHLAQRLSAPLEAIRGEHFVAFEKGLRIREEIDHALAIRQVEVNTVIEFDNIETIKRAIEAGEGVSLLPSPTVEREVAIGSLAAVPLAGQQLVRPLGIVHQRTRSLGEPAKQFVQLLKEAVSVENHAESHGVNGKAFSDYVT